MAKSPPSHAVRLTTFAELEPYVRAFGAGHLNLLMIFGPPGVGKSRSVRQALGSQVCWIGGQATPFGIYLQAYEHRHEPIVLDDVDGLYSDRQGVRLLKALHEDDQKTIKEMLPNLGQPDGDIYDTGLKVVVPDEGSPLKAEMFESKTQFLRLSEFRKWLTKYNLTGS